jgi:hypothetical protein
MIKGTTSTLPPAFESSMNKYYKTLSWLKKEPWKTGEETGGRKTTSISTNPLKR